METEAAQSLILALLSGSGFEVQHKKIDSGY